MRRYTLHLKIVPDEAIEISAETRALLAARHKAPSSLDVGPPPWTEATLIEAVGLHGWDAVSRALERHPAAKPLRALQRVQTGARMLYRAVERFHAAAIRLRDGATSGIFDRARRAELQSLRDELEDALYMAVGASQSLVAYCRRLNSAVSLPGYDKKRSSVFDRSSRHSFLKALRNHLAHSSITDLRDEFRIDGHGEHVSLTLDPGYLLRDGDSFNSSDEKCLEGLPNPVDLISELSAYENDVRTLQEWIGETFESQIGHQVSDYRRCRRCLNAIGDRFSFGLVVQAAIKSGVKGYDVLDRWLTRDELHDVQRFQHGSVAQVDRIIALVDENHTCTPELRAQVQRLFGVEVSPLDPRSRG